jgi:hypothetical protein
MFVPRLGEARGERGASAPVELSLGAGSMKLRRRSPGRAALKRGSCWTPAIAAQSRYS